MTFCASDNQMFYPLYLDFSYNFQTSPSMNVENCIPFGSLFYVETMYCQCFDRLDHKDNVRVFWI